MRNLATSAKRENSCRQADARRDRAQLAPIVRAILDGAHTHTLKARLTALEQEKAQTETRFAYS